MSTDRIIGWVAVLLLVYGAIETASRGMFL